MNKIDLKYSLQHEYKLSKILQSMSLNMINKKENDFDNIFKEVSNLLLDFTIRTQEKYKTFDVEKDKEKHIEIIKEQLIEIKRYAKAQSKWIEKNRYNKELKKKALRHSELKARNVKGNVYANFLKNIVSKDTDGFIWNTVGDDRVRPEHEDRDQEFFTWKNADLLPGEDYMCRCWATIVIIGKEIIN